MPCEGNVSDVNSIRKAPSWESRTLLTALDVFLRVYQMLTNFVEHLKYRGPKNCVINYEEIPLHGALDILTTAIASVTYANTARGTIQRPRLYNTFFTSMKCYETPGVPRNVLERVETLLQRLRTSSTIENVTMDIRDILTILGKLPSKLMSRRLETFESMLKEASKKSMSCGSSKRPLVDAETKTILTLVNNFIHECGRRRSKKRSFPKVCRFCENVVNDVARDLESFCCDDAERLHHVWKEWNVRRTIEGSPTLISRPTVCTNDDTKFSDEVICLGERLKKYEDEDKKWHVPRDGKKRSDRKYEKTEKDETRNLMAIEDPSVDEKIDSKRTWISSKGLPGPKAAAKGLKRNGEGGVVGGYPKNKGKGAERRTKEATVITEEDEKKKSDAPDRTRREKASRKLDEEGKVLKSGARRLRLMRAERDKGNDSGLTKKHEAGSEDKTTLRSGARRRRTKSTSMVKSERSKFLDSGETSRLDRDTSQGPHLRVKRAIDTRQCDEEMGPPNTIQYQLSNEHFIELGWTVLPITKTMRRIVVYQTRPAKPLLNWFKKYRQESTKYYDDVDRLKSFICHRINGSSMVFYPNGEIAIEMHLSKKYLREVYTVFTPGGKDIVEGRMKEGQLIAVFDTAGNGVVLNEAGDTRLSYNQIGGICADNPRGGLPFTWTWDKRSLSCPPIVQAMYTEKSADELEKAFFSKPLKSSARVGTPLYSSSTTLQTLMTTTTTTTTAAAAATTTKEKQKKVEVQKPVVAVHVNEQTMVEEEEENEEKEGEKEEGESGYVEDAKKVECLLLARRIRLTYVYAHWVSCFLSECTISIVCDWHCLGMVMPSEAFVITSVDSDEEFSRKMTNNSIQTICMRINEYLSLRIIDRSNINLQFFAGTKSVRIELGIIVNFKKELTSYFVDSTDQKTDVLRLTEKWMDELELTSDLSEIEKKHRKKKKPNGII